MKQGRFSESQIFQVLKEAEAGVPELCRKHGMSSALFYKWLAKFGGMDVSNMKRLKEFEEENARLKKMRAEETLKAEIVTEAIENERISLLTVTKTSVAKRLSSRRSKLNYGQPQTQLLTETIPLSLTSRGFSADPHQCL